MDSECRGSVPVRVQNASALNPVSCRTGWTSYCWVQMKNLCIEMLAGGRSEVPFSCCSGDVCEDDTIGHTMARFALRASSWTHPKQDADHLPNYFCSDGGQP